MSKTLYFPVLTLLSALLAGAAGCSKSADGKAENTDKIDAVPVVLAPIRTEEVQRTVDVVGTLCGNEEATISAKVNGRLIRICCDMGDRVAAGATLAEIDPTDSQLALAQKETTLRATLAQLGLKDPPDEKFDPDQVPTVARARWQSENSKARRDRGKQLFEQTPKIISEEDYEDLKAAANVAESAYQAERLNVRALAADIAVRMSDIDAARQKVVDTSVLAPGTAAQARPSGRVAQPPPAVQDTEKVDSSPRASQPMAAEPRSQGPAAPALPGSYAVAARMASLGEYVREGTAMFRLVADNPIKFRVQASERYAAETAIGQAVQVTVASRKEIFNGRVSRISPQVDPANRTYQLEIAVDNSQGLLKAGSFARGSILTRMEPRVTFVPLDAIVTFAGATKVFIVRDGTAVEVPVRTGIRRDSAIEVTGDLAGATHVVTTGVSKLAAGVPVAVREKAAGPAAPTPTAPAAR
jgi:multidrug efflux pump subunit AcrA (membrane-fusion protein)